jgi:hypothetical protein
VKGSRTRRNDEDHTIHGKQRHSLWRCTEKHTTSMSSPHRSTDTISDTAECGVKRSQTEADITKEPRNRHRHTSAAIDAGTFADFAQPAAGSLLSGRRFVAPLLAHGETAQYPSSFPLSLSHSLNYTPSPSCVATPLSTSLPPLQILTHRSRVLDGRFANRWFHSMFPSYQHTSANDSTERIMGYDMNLGDGQSARTSTSNLSTHLSLLQANPFRVRSRFSDLPYSVPLTSFARLEPTTLQRSRQEPNPHARQDREFPTSTGENLTPWGAGLFNAFSSRATGSAGVSDENSRRHMASGDALSRLHMHTAMTLPPLSPDAAAIEPAMTAVATSAPTKKPHLHLPKTLQHPDDKLLLCDHHVLLRHQIEVFEATEDDINVPTRGRNKCVQVGQVGIRCRHCKNVPVFHRQRGSMYFPFSTSGIYQAAQNMSSTHLQCGLCRGMPEALKQQFAELIPSRTKGSAVGQPYWTQCAREMGLVDTEDGIRFVPNLQQLKSTQKE